MTPEQPARIVGRCTVCGELTLEVVRVERGGSGLTLDADVFRRCGCGEWKVIASEPGTT